LNSGRYIISCKNIYVGKGKPHTKTGHEGPEREYRYTSILSITLALDGVDEQHHDPVAIHRERDMVYIVQKAVWAPELVWTSAKNLAYTTNRSPDRPARSESL
jgi:hypothetical protein